MKKELTLLTVIEKLDQLSNKVELGFNGFNEKFQGIEEKFTGIDKQFEGINKRFDIHDEFFVAIKQSFNHVDDRFSKVADRLDLIETNMSTQSQFDKLLSILEDNRIVSKSSTKFVKALP